MKDAVRLGHMFARNPRPLLVHGPDGCGKRTLGRWIHAWSPLERMLEVDCAKPGGVGTLMSLLANGLTSVGRSTLHAIGVDALPPHAQHALATAIEGSPRCRVIGTSRTRGRIVGRLQHVFALQLKVPSLRERHGDLVPLAAMFMHELASPPTSTLGYSAWRYLRRQQAWPRNVLGLRLLLSTAVQSTPDPVIHERHLRAVRCAALRAQTQPASEPSWARAQRPRVLRRAGPYRCSSALEIRIRDAGPPGGSLPPLPTPLPLPAWPVSPACLAGLPALPALPALPGDPAGPLRALPADPQTAKRARQAPTVPQLLESSRPELQQLYEEFFPKPVFPERSRWPRIALACARQLRFTNEGVRAVGSATSTFLLTVALLMGLALCFGEQATRRAPAHVAAVSDDTPARGAWNPLPTDGSWPERWGALCLVLGVVVCSFARQHDPSRSPASRR